jgi:hypothetical protein
MVSRKYLEKDFMELLQAFTDKFIVSLALYDGRNILYMVFTVAVK